MLEMLQPEDVNLVIAHGNCPDGLGAAWAAWKMHKSDIEYYFATHGSKDMPNVEGKNVLMVDFAYSSPEIMNDLNEKANKMLLLDHHKSAREALEGKIDCDHIFNMERSGARMAWDFFYPNSRTPDLILYIEDRDLWKWGLPDSRGFLASLNSFPQTFDTFDEVSELSQKEIRDFISEGHAIMRMQRIMINQAVKHGVTGNLMTPDGIFYKCMISNNSSRELISDIGHDMAKIAGVALVWHYSHERDTNICSLRSDGTVDVSKIATKFGGGGHHNASGFEYKGKITDIFFTS
jgi:oligoribonuclease NrnB/cAMP/cGMP phosphodiesterase (DHH superfamily)